MLNTLLLRRAIPTARYCALCAGLALAAPAVHAQTKPVVAPPPTPAVTADTTKPDPLIINRVVAVVNSEPILLSDVMDRAIRMRQYSPTMDPADLQAAALAGLIEDQLLLQRAKIEKVEIAEGDVQTAANDDFKEVRAKFQSEAEFTRALKESGFGSIDEYKRMNENTLRNEMTKRDLIGKLKQAGRIPAVNVSEAEVTAEFVANKDKLPKREASVGFRQIILPINPSEASKRRARAKIDSLEKELQAHPEDFESIAKRESMDGTKELGGDLGWSRRGKTVPAFERVMFNMNPGVISPVVETVFGYHLIRVDRVKAGEVKARHILIKFTIDSADQARSMQLADSVAALWRAGANVDTLTAKFHDTGHEEEASVPDFPLDKLPETYQAAIKGRKVGDIIGPFAIHDAALNLDKPILLQLTDMKEAGDLTLEEMRQQIRANLTEARSMRRFLDSLKAQAYVWTLEPVKAHAADTKK